MLPLLVACDLPLRLLHQVAHPADLGALPHGVLDGLGESQSGFPDPLVQPPVDCRTNTPIRHGVVSGTRGTSSGRCTHIPHSGRRTPPSPPAR